MAKLGEVVSALERLWPLDLADSWDNPGLALGDVQQEVSSILLAVDVTLEVLEEAEVLGANLVVSHHPALFRPISTLAGDGAVHKVLRTAISKEISLFSAHTNVDHIPGGVSHVFAESMGLKDLTPLDALSGHGRVGNLSDSIALHEFAQHLANLLPHTARRVLVQGEPGRIIKRVAVLAGAGDSFLDQALASDIDVYVTSDLRHHPALDWKIRGGPTAPALICVSHWASESLWLASCSEMIGAVLPGIRVSISKTNTDPWDFAI